jgi:serine O-acetyltransferase
LLISLGSDRLFHYLCVQLRNFFPDDNSKVEQSLLKQCWDLILQRTEYCFSHVNNKYFRSENNVLFNHLNSDQYAMFLYFAANTVYIEGHQIGLAEKLFLLNKYLHGIDAYYEVRLPDIFLFVHPLATVLGRGEYGNFFVVYQRCNIGSNHDIYPRLGEHCTMHPGSSILGDCEVGCNCKIAAGSLLMDMNLEKNTVYIGSPRDYVMKEQCTTSSIWRE